MPITTIYNLREGDIFACSNGELNVEITRLHYNNHSVQYRPLSKPDTIISGRKRRVPRGSNTQDFHIFISDKILIEKSKNASFELASNKKRFTRFYDNFDRAVISK